MTQMDRGGEILTVRELCDLLRVHPTTVYRLLRKGKIPGFRIGGIWRFDREQIVRWMAEQTKPPGPMRAVLTERECEVLKLRLTDNLTPKQIGQRLGITSERVRQIETSAKRKLQRARLIPPVSN